MLRPYARFRAHTHSRPLFRCRACGAAWPCQPAKLALLRIYQSNPAALRDMLANRLLAAIEDQPQADPVILATRMLGWVPPDL